MSAERSAQTGPPGSTSNPVRVPVANFVRKAMGLLSICDDCGHQHTADGCTGEPTASDLWAGVSPSSCDCAWDGTAPPEVTP